MHTDPHTDPLTRTLTHGKWATGNRFLFTGREFFSSISLYNYRNRFYSGTWGRFLQPDPIGFSGDPANLYRYVGNNPVNASDPMGTATNKLDGGGDSEPTNASAWGNPHAGGLPDFLIGTDGNAGAGLYIFNKGNAGINLGGGLIFEGPANRGGLSFNGKPVLPATPVNGSQNDVSMGLVSGSTEPSGPTRLSDSDVVSSLDALIANKIAGIYVASMSIRDLSGLGGLDTKFHDNPNSIYSYSGSLGPPAGNYYSSAVNYVGIGAGFAAGDYSKLTMYAAITRWKAGYLTQGLFFKGGEFSWASAGYNYYRSHPPGG